MLKFLVKLEHILPKTSACFFITFTTLPLICEHILPKTSACFFITFTTLPLICYFFFLSLFLRTGNNLKK